MNKIIENDVILRANKSADGSITQGKLYRGRVTKEISLGTRFVFISDRGDLSDWHISHFERG